MERGTAPSWHRALAMAASGCARLCLDERSQPGGEWFDAVADYCRGPIRKVTRRGRAAQWEATAALPGITLGEAATQIRVLLPGLVTDLDKRVAKLQVGGTDFARDEPAPAPRCEALQILVPPNQLTAGKLMAQMGHAGMLAAALLTERPQALLEWAGNGCPSHVTGVSAGQWRQLVRRLRDPLPAWRQDGLLAVRDAGFTEVAPGTVTVIARWPGQR